MFRLSIAMTATFVACASLTFTDLARAQTMDVGRREYEQNCAVCHGVEGRGNGPLAAMLNQPVTDLQNLQADNGGVFPAQRLYEIIDGRQEVAAHGTRAMPVWGDIYSAEAPGQLGELFTAADTEVYVRGRILSLIGHISTLQQDEAKPSK
nr:cytochrome c [Rhizobium sp. TCK]